MFTPARPPLRSCRATLGLGLALVLLSRLLSSADPAPASPASSTGGDLALVGDTLRLLHGDCFSCHNPAKHRGGLDLTSRDKILAGGESGPALVPGQPDPSRLLLALGPEADPHMPPKKQLTTNQVALVRRWIAAGAPWDADLVARLTAPRTINPGPLPPGHHPVLALALSPNGSRLAIGRGRHLVVHDVAATNFPVLHDLDAHRDQVRAIAWSPDGRRLATGGYRELTVRDAETLAPLWSLSTHQLAGRINALRFTPHGGALVVADGSPSEPGTVRLFAATNGAPLNAWTAHVDTINDLVVSPDGGLLATAGSDKLVKTWELVSGLEVGRFEGHVGAVTGVAFDTNATTLVSVGADKQLKLWDTKTRESIVTMGGRRFGLNATAWSADGSRVAAVDDDGRLTAFTDFKRHSGEQSSATANERQLGRWPSPLHAVALSRDGQSLFAGGQDGIVYAVDAEGRIRARLEAPAVSPPANSPTVAEATAPPATPVPTAARPPSFVHDVLPLLAKSGCSAGSCHAKADGQAGFKLSVFSYDPAFDFGEITVEGRGRRLFPAAPEESLLLLKPTGALEHGGGRRLDPESAAYRTLLDWIRGGLVYQHPDEAALAGIAVEPAEGTYHRGDSQPLRVVARYADGSTRDVTALTEYLANDKEIVQVDDHGVLRVGSLAGQGAVVARFMGFVAASLVTVPAEHTLPAERYSALPTNSFIDHLAYDRFRKLGLFPSEPCTDAEFLRRASLDILGVLPTAAETRAFLAEAGTDPSDAATQARRAALVDRLLQRPEFADYWANKWADLVRPNPDRVGVKSVFTLDQWLREAFRENRPLDRFARDFLLAEGSNHRDGPVVVYRDRREPPELTTLFSQLFLGVRMECAKCHHHPNEKWSQDDFYRFAAFFGPLKQKGAGLSPPISAGTETFYHGPGGAVKHPVTDAVMTPRPPDGPELPAGFGPADDPRQALADWLTAPDNPFFARALVNRVWANFFGRGFVEPVDDFRVSNPPSNEALLAALASDFAGHGFDLKQLVRRITTSRLYQLGSEPNETNLADTRQFSRSYRRRLPAEVLLDAVNDLTGATDDFNGCPPGTRAMQTWSYKVQSQFLDAFGRPNPSSDCPCERDVRSSVVQSLHLMNSRRLHEKLGAATGRVRQLADGPLPATEVVAELYLAALGRPPSLSEYALASATFAHPEATRRTAAEDLLWALLNSPEFVFNH